MAKILKAGYEMNAVVSQHYDEVTGDQMDYPESRKLIMRIQQEISGTI